MNNPNTSRPFNEIHLGLTFKIWKTLQKDAVSNFLQILPQKISLIETRNQIKNSGKLKLEAHSLKGIVATFYAEPSRLLAWQLEQIGHGGNLDGVENIFLQLKTELERLKEALTKSFFIKKRYSSTLYTAENA